MEEAVIDDVVEATRPVIMACIFDYAMFDCSITTSNSYFKYLLHRQEVL